MFKRSARRLNFTLRNLPSRTQMTQLGITPYLVHRVPKTYLRYYPAIHFEIGPRLLMEKDALAQYFFLLSSCPVITHLSSPKFDRCSAARVEMNHCTYQYVEEVLVITAHYVVNRYTDMAHLSWLFSQYTSIIFTSRPKRFPHHLRHSFPSPSVPTSY